MTARKKRSFFDTYPREYDFLTDASAREKPHRKEVKAIIDKFHPTAVLDAGCATGLTSRLFAGESISTVGLDRVDVMVSLAQANSPYDKTLLSFMAGSFERLPKALTGKFDLIVCLANSISGVGTMANLRKAILNFRRVLRPGGNIIIQMLNYAAVKEGQLMPVRATRNDEIVYERFTERQGKRLNLYITRLDLKKRPPSLEIFRHEMDNFSSTEVTSSIRSAGFKNIRRYSDLFFLENYSRTSRDLVITARRSTR